MSTVTRAIPVRDASSRARFGLAAVAALAYSALNLAWLHWAFGGPTATKFFSDLSGCLAAGLAATACTFAWRRAADRARRAWGFLAASLVLYAFGEIVWTTYELALGRDVPFPSLADVGYLGAVPLSAIAILSFPTAPHDVRSELRTVLDALVVGASLFFIAWATYLAPVFHASSGSLTKQAIGLAYPVSDVVVAAIVLFVLARARPGGRTPLALLAAGLFALAFSDSAFAYLTARNEYSTGSGIDAGWVIAYLLIALAALRAVPQTERDEEPQPTTVRAAVPYLAVVIAIVIVAVKRIDGGHVEPVLFWGMLVIVLLVVSRQLLTLIENQSLTATLRADAAVRQDLIDRAFHDPLTGLANRALFRDRAQHALERSARSRRPVSLLYCDLDDLKQVNDEHGHQVGDKLLAAVGERLTECVRRSDTVGRLGGDEFAILLEDGADEAVAVRLAERISGALRVPFEIAGEHVPTGMSIGIAVSDTGDNVDDLLREADCAMYVAKSEGKGRYELFRPVMWTMRELRASPADDVS